MKYATSPTFFPIVKDQNNNNFHVMGVTSNQIILKEFNSTSMINIDIAELSQYKACMPRKHKTLGNILIKGEVLLERRKIPNKGIVVNILIFNIPMKTKKVLKYEYIVPTVLEP